MIQALLPVRHPLRIPLAARVKFIQFIGRFLRVCTPYEPWYEEDLALWGPKHSATIIDPYRLLESLGLSHPEALGRAMEEEAEKAARKAFKDLTKTEIAAKLAELPLPNAVDRFKGWPHSGHVMLARGERSRLADFASEVL